MKSEKQGEFETDLPIYGCPVSADLMFAVTGMITPGET